MVNFGLNAAAILGLFLAVAGAGLFFLRSIRPELARDYDIFFAAVGLLCGIILLFNGWRLDPILQFGQFLLTGTAVFFAFESIRMRGVATEQARRNTPTVDRDRPVSRTRVYTEAELDKIDPYDNAYEGAKPNYSNPRLRGYEDPQPRSARRSEVRRRPAPTTDLRDEPQRRPSRSRPEPVDYPERPVQSDSYREKDSRPRRRPTSSPVEQYDDWSPKDEWADNSRTSPRPRPRPSREDSYSEPMSPPTVAKRRPSPADLGRSYEPEENNDNYGSDDLGGAYDDSEMGRSYEEDQPIPGDYVVDYQPLDDAETDYSEDYDDSPQDDYNDYDNSEDEYDDYSDRPTGRKPLNFNDR
jgi:hypothetical protein